MTTLKKPEHPELNRFLPDLGTLPLVILPILLFIKPETMLQDPGIGWHLISGHYMLDHKTILDHDIFSFTRPEQTWMVKEWLFQCFAAALDKIGGLPLLSAVTALIYGSLPVILYKTMARKNINIYISLILLFVTFLGLAAHCHARPHIFTYLFFIIFMDRIFAYDTGEITAVSLFWFIPIMILWCNLHGGFVVALASAGLAFLVALYQCFRIHSTDHLDKVKTYFLFGAGLTAASLINPYGWHLHFRLMTYLSSDLLHKWNEFASPDFNYGGITPTIFLFLSLTIFILSYRKKTSITLLEFTFLLFFMYHAFHAVRHVFLFLLLAIPIIARELTLITDTRDNWFTQRSRSLLADQKHLKGDRIFIPFICTLLIGLSLVMPSLFKTDFYSSSLTPGAARFITDNMDRFKRPFNTVDIGGALAYHFWPDIKIFTDDRLDYYGDDFYLEHYFKITGIDHDWAKVLDDFQVDSAIINNTALVTLIKLSPDWDMVYEEEKTHIFFRKSW